MSRLKQNAILVALGCLLFGLSHVGLADTLPKPANEVFSISASRARFGELTLNWRIEPGNYLYRESLRATLDGRGVPLAVPPGKEKDDPNFGKVEVYYTGVEARVDASPGPSGHLTVTYQGCAERGICYPPLTKVVDIATLAVSDARPNFDAKSETDAIAATAVEYADAAQTTPSAPATTDMPSALLSGSVGWMLVGFLGFGLLLALTPCVFPMIPILSGMLARSGDQLSAARGCILSASYVLAMSSAYGGLGFAAGWSGQNLQAALQTPWALGLMSAVFVVLALSMFGLFDLQLPAGVAARMSGRHMRGGSVAGAAALGFSSALIVSPCVTPPLAAAMLYAAQTGEAGKGAAALFMLGLGMGLPLVAFGTFGGRVLPKSGRWLEQIKQVFGFVFLVVAASLIARLVPGPVELAVWGLVGLGTGVFLGGLDRISARSGWSERLGKTAGIAAIVYGAALIVGFAGGASDPMRPLGFLAGGPAGRIAQAATTVVSAAGFDRALAAQASEKSPVLVSFTAGWCTICKSNENVMDDPVVRTRLNRIAIVSVDVTDYDEDARTLMKRFSVVGPPTLFLLDTQGRELPGSRLTGAITADAIVRRLADAGA